MTMTTRTTANRSSICTSVTEARMVVVRSVSTDTFTAALAQTFAAKDVLGTGGSTLAVTADTVNDGNGGADYTVTLHAATGTITPAALTISAVPASKTYDGTTSAAGTPTVSGLFTAAGDTVTGLSQAFAAKDVLGAGLSTVAVTGYTVNDGNGGADYTVTTPTTTGTITSKAAAVTPNSASKTFGSSDPALTGTLSGFLPADGVTASYTRVAGETVAGGPYTISATLSPTGVLGNYNITYNTANFTITPVATISAGSIYVLDATASGALSLSLNAAVNIPGNVVVDSSSSSAIVASGASQVSAASVQVAGGVSKSGTAKVTKTGSPATSGDPLAGLSAPVATSLGLAAKGAVNLNGSATQTIVPGVYSKISVSNIARLTLNPGLYIITGGGFVVSGSGSVVVAGPASALTGTGVLIYNAGTGYNLSTGADSGTYGGITFSGNGAINLAQPSTGAYSGITIFQARDNSTALTLNGSAMQGITGAIYAQR